jgi:hypothetical protein
LVGTWADALCAIRFYEEHAFRIVRSQQKDDLLRRYWTIPERQIETSMVWQIGCSGNSMWSGEDFSTLQRKVEVAGVENALSLPNDGQSEVMLTAANNRKSAYEIGSNLLC